MAAVGEEPILLPQENSGQDEGADALPLPCKLGQSRHIWVASFGLFVLGLLAVLLSCFSGHPTDIHDVQTKEVELLSSVCSEYPYLRLHAHDAVKRNNLGRKGPDSGPEGMILRATDMSPSASQDLGREVDVVLNEIDNHYLPWAAHANGMKGKFGTVNLHSGSSLDVVVSFQDPETGKSIKLKEVAVTFFDLDTGLHGTSVESVVVGSFGSYRLSQDTEVDVLEEGDGRMRFTGTTYGTGDDNPTDSLRLTEQQKNRAVSLVFRDLDKLHVTFSAGPGKGPRYFIFVFRPSVLCATTVKEGANGRLEDLAVKNSDEEPVKAKPKHTFVKWMIKKEATVRQGDPLCISKDAMGNNHTYFSPCDGFVVALQDGLKPGDSIDKRLDSKILAVVQEKHFDVLGPLDKNNHQAAIVRKGSVFVKYKVKVGDIVKEGDVLAIVKDSGVTEHNVTAPQGGMITAVQTGLVPGMTVDLIEDHNLATIGKFASLPVKGPHEQPTRCGEANTVFVKYHVQDGDIVENGDVIATLRRLDGSTIFVKTSRPGVVKDIQWGLREGMDLANVMVDDNLATIGPLPQLATSNAKKGTFIPDSDEWGFEAWRVKVGDQVNKDDTIALLKNTWDGRIKAVQAQKGGTVLELQDHLRRGDIVKRVLPDADLATIGKFSKPKVGFMETTVEVPDTNLVFDYFLVKEGDWVDAGDEVVQLTQGKELASAGYATARRLEQSMTIPAPSAGHINWVMPLKRGKKISEQSFSPAIAKIKAPLPWWPVLLCALLMSCGCMTYLHQVMDKPASSYTPVKPVIVHPEPQPVRAPRVVPDLGIRLDFDDQGTNRTVYARYKPLGIKHLGEAPIVVQDFTVNSYAKAQLGVKRGWKLTRIGREELNDSDDVAEVNGKLEQHMRDLPLWPLVLEFRQKGTGQSTIVEFDERPIGLEFANKAPIEVRKVHQGSPAQREGVREGWIITKIGDYDVHESHDFRQVLRAFKEGVKTLDEFRRVSVESSEP